MRAGSRESGQASVELVALLPLLVAVVIGSWQVVVAAQAWWLAGTAARAASRAAIIGGDPAKAARAALPSGWARRVSVSGTGGTRLTVRLRIPLVVGGSRLADASASAGPATGTAAARAKPATGNATASVERATAEPAR